MPNIKSAKKRVKVLKSNLKTVLKGADAALAGNAEGKDEALRLAIKKIDQAAAKGLIHKNNAARKKASLAKRANQAG